MTTMRAVKIAPNGDMDFLNLEPTLEVLIAEFDGSSTDFQYGPSWVLVREHSVRDVVMNPVADAVAERFSEPGTEQKMVLGTALIFGYSPDAPGTPDFPGVCDLPDDIDAFLVAVQAVGVRVVSQGSWRPPADCTCKLCTEGEWSPAALAALDAARAELDARLAPPGSIQPGVMESLGLSPANPRHKPR
jgi:hypothetical protein